MTVISRELPLVVQSHRVGRPMRGKRRDRRALGCAGTDLVAPVAAVFGREHQFAPHLVVVALRPTVVAAPFQEQQLFSRKRGLFVGFVQIRPIRMQLIPTVLRDE